MAKPLYVLLNNNPNLILWEELNEELRHPSYQIPPPPLFFFLFIHEKEGKMPLRGLPNMWTHHLSTFSWQLSLHCPTYNNNQRFMRTLCSLSLQL